MKSSTELRKELKEAIRRERAEKLKSGKHHPNKDWQPLPNRISVEEMYALRAKRTPKGFSKANLAKMGVPWPPPPNWKSKLISAAAEFYGIPMETVRAEAKFLRKKERIQHIERQLPEPPTRKVFKKHVSK